MNNNEITRGFRMNLADLCDTTFDFNCNFSGDACEYWDYDLTAKVHDYEYYRSMSRTEIEQLRDNCKRILQATEGC